MKQEEIMYVKALQYIEMCSLLIVITYYFFYQQFQLVIYYISLCMEKSTKSKINAIPLIKVVDGKYHIKKKILGSGSFATTYLAITPEPYCIYACKMIEKANILQKIKNSKNTEADRIYIISSIKKEVNTWKQLVHKNIVKFYDFSETANNIYFFLEYCEQGNLEEIIKSKGRIKEIVAIKYIKDIVEGCSFLYDKGIFHRDLKPENILIHDGNAKIADFGFAKVMQEAQKKDNPQAQTNIGTPYYMAPQILDGKPYSIKCDVWSLGVLIYKVLYGICPWSCQSMMDLAKAVKKTIKFPQNDEISTQMKNLISRMLAQEQTNRISIKELQVQINNLYKKLNNTAMEIQ